MPRQAGKLTTKTKYVYAKDEAIQIWDTYAPSTAGLWYLISKILSIEEGDIIIPTSMDYFFNMTEPADDHYVRMCFVVGDKSLNKGDTRQLHSMTGSMKHYDSKSYEISAGGYAIVESGRFIDFDPDWEIEGSDRTGNELQVWFVNNQNNVAISFSCVVWYIAKLRQRTFPNDNAFLDYSMDEIQGNLYVCGQNFGNA